LQKDSWLPTISFKNENIFLSCRQIGTNIGTATAFFFRYKQKNFFVTAKHVITNKKHFKKKTIEFIDQGEESDIYETRVYYHPTSHCDVCVLQLPFDCTTMKSLSVNSSGLQVGGKNSIYGFPTKHQYPNSVFDVNDLLKPKMAVCCQGTLSSVEKSNDVLTLFIDVISQEGFSGSPIVAFDENESPYVIGVLSAGQFDYIDIFDKNWNQLIKKGIIFTGFTTATYIGYVIDIIEENGLLK
jgi:hypothetical protein